jgi:acyl-[acyl-carrier-protein] desaturase
MRKNMNITDTKKDVMQHLGKSTGDFITDFLKPANNNWQPADFLPDAKSGDFMEQLKNLQETAKDIDDDLMAVVVGDTITEEALPTYEAWLMGVEGIDQEKEKGWAQWVRAWTAEENRHGDLLNKYLFLSGRVNMREFEITTQHLISDGVNIQTSMDPYRNFIYTSFQETATNISHRRVAQKVKQSGNALLAKMCAFIASDEARHAKAYQFFVKKIFELDPSEMMLAFEDMMRKKITMPAYYIRESGGKAGELFEKFSDAAQRTKVYTTFDYINILKGLLKEWDLANISGLNGQAEKARDYLMALPSRLLRISERMKINELKHDFKWIIA